MITAIQILKLHSTSGQILINRSISITTMKQKIVIKVTINGKKSRSKAIKIAVGQPGVESVAFQGAEKDQLVLIGDGVDSIVLITLLRKSMDYAELVSVGAPEEKKEEKKEAKSELVMQPMITWPMVYQGVPSYHTYEDHSNREEPNCTIM